MSTLDQVLPDESGDDVEWSRRLQAHYAAAKRREDKDHKNAIG